MDYFHLHRDRCCVAVRRVQYLADRVLQRVRTRRCARKHVNRPVHVQHHLRCRIARSIQKRYRRRNFNPANRKRHFRKVRRKAVQRVVIFNNIAQARTARVSVHRTVTVVLGYNRCGFHLHRDRRRIAVRRVQYHADRVLQRVRTRRCARKHVNRPVRVQHHLRCRIARSIQKRYRRRNFNPTNRKRHFSGIHGNAVQRIRVKCAYNIVRARITVNARRAVVHSVYGRRINLHRDRRRIAVRRIQYFANRVLQCIRTGRRTRKHVNRPVRVQHHLRRRVAGSIQERYRRRNFNPANRKCHFRKVRRKAVQRVVIFNNIAQARTARVSVHRTVTVVLGYNRCGFHLHRDRCCVAVRRVQYLADRVLNRVRTRRRTGGNTHNARRRVHRRYRTTVNRRRRRHHRKRHFRKVRECIVKRVVLFHRIAYIGITFVAVHRTCAVIVIRRVYRRDRNQHRDGCIVAVQRIQDLANLVLNRVRIRRRTGGNTHNARRRVHRRYRTTVNRRRGR